MAAIREIKELPKKTIGHRRPNEHGLVVNIINVFLYSDMKYGLIDSSLFSHANGNNLRKDFANTIERMRLDDKCWVTIRGNNVYLFKKENGNEIG